MLKYTTQIIIDGHVVAHWEYETETLRLCRAKLNIHAVASLVSSLEQILVERSWEKQEHINAATHNAEDKLYAAIPDNDNEYPQPPAVKTDFREHQA